MIKVNIDLIKAWMFHSIKAEKESSWEWWVLSLLPFGVYITIFHMTRKSIPNQPDVYNPDFDLPL